MKSLVYLVLALAIIGWQACSNSQKKTDEDVKNTTDSAAIIKNGDNEFVKNAANGSLMEIELGKLAQANSSNERIKSFGSMMVKDHGNAYEQLKSLVSSKNIVLPTTLGEDHQKHLDHLKDRKGPAFDLSYMKMMVKDHRGDIKRFKDAAEDAVDADIRTFAVETLPILQKHLDSAKAIHTAIKPAIDNIIVP